MSISFPLPFRPAAYVSSAQGHAQIAADENGAPRIIAGAWRDDFAEIDESRWNRSFPYQLLVLEPNPNGGYQAKTDWKFTLPIPPEAISISTPFASRVDAALEGVVEQNGGVRFRYITMRGTTGVMPLRPTSEGTPQYTGPVGLTNAIFGGTIRAVERDISAVISGDLRQAPNLLEDSFEEFSGIPTGKKLPKRGTGYFHFLMLERFLLSYAEAKKKDSGKNLRLALAVWKTNTVYLVQPQAFETSQDATSPHERKYMLRFKAWARIDPLSLSSSTTEIVRPPFGRAVVTDVLNRIVAAHRALVDARAAFAAVRSEFSAQTLNTSRQVMLFCKYALGASPSLVDLPSAIAKDFHAAFNRHSPEAFQRQLVRAVDQKNSNARASLDAVLSGPGQSEAVFENVNDNYDLLSQVRPDMIPLPQTTLGKIDAERARVTAFTRLDFERQRDSIVQASVEFSDAVGAGSDTYNSIYGRTALASKNKQVPSEEDWNVIFALNEIAIQTGRLASYADVEQRTTSPVEYIAGLARGSGIAFTVPNSKFAVPFPYGSTLEQLAARYLGTPDRWHEIVALNSLRSPYVDEVGFDLPLLVNARGNVVVVGDATNLYLGQAVWLQGRGTAFQKRHIQNIDKSAPGQVKLLLDGDAVDQFTTAVDATLHAHLPGTINSQMLVFIPSSAQPNDDGATKGVPGVDYYDHLLRIGGMDLLLTPKRDLALGSDGDGRIAQGLTNILQIATINLNLPYGSMPRHPSLGFAIKPGTNTGDLSARDMLDAARAALAPYSMFTGVQNALVVKSGPTAQMAFSVGLQGVDELLRIGVDVER